MPKCAICGKKCATGAGLAAHVRAQHPETPPLPKDEENYDPDHPSEQPIPYTVADTLMEDKISEIGRNAMEKRERMAGSILLGHTLNYCPCCGMNLHKIAAALET